jgi:hypothetical protein
MLPHLDETTMRAPAAGRTFSDLAALEHALVPLDGSARAEEALHVVELLAESLIHAVTLLRVIDAPTQGPEAACGTLRANDDSISHPVEG